MLLEIHCHTDYSRGIKVKYDGVTRPADVIAAAARKGLDAIAITDHNTMKGYEQAKRWGKKYGIAEFPGEEMNTRDGHVLAFGIQETIRPGLSALDTIDRIHSQGGLAVAVHPFDIKHEGLGQLSFQCDAVETFNAINVDRLSNMHAKRFCRSHDMPFTAGSDAHSAEMIGRAVNELRADSLDTAIKAIKKRRNIIHPHYHSALVMMNWALDRLRLSEPDVRAYVDGNYRWHKRMASRKLIGLLKYSPGRVDHLFKTMAYVSLGSVFTYGMVKEMMSFLAPR